MPLGVCDDEATADRFSASSGAKDGFRDRAPRRLFFSLNFSIQLEVRVCWFSGVVVVAEKARALSRITSSVRGMPFFSCASHEMASSDQVHNTTYLILRPHSKSPFNVR